MFQLCDLQSHCYHDLTVVDSIDRIQGVDLVGKKGAIIWADRKDNTAVHEGNGDDQLSTMDIPKF